MMADASEILDENTPGLSGLLGPEGSAGRDT